MSSSTLYLPTPVNAAKPKQQQAPTETETTPTPPADNQQQNKPIKRAPTYEERCNAGRFQKNTQNKANKKPFVPRKATDFDDGGAFPEIHVAQYPRHMGNPHKQKQQQSIRETGTASLKTNLLNVEIDEKGLVNYDAVVTGGTNTNSKVYTRHSDIVPLANQRKSNEDDTNANDIALPTAEEAKLASERTQSALQALISTKVQSAKPTGSAILQANTSTNAYTANTTQFISYTADPNAPGYNANCSRRVIQMVQAKVDPMMPPKFKHKKVPRGPADDPVPILHSKPAKLTKEEQDKWKVPACISNWKNTRGYTIPLDKRLAADGRNLMEHSINSNFANLAESLYVAERQAREEVNMRAKVRGKLAEQEASKREEELRQLAMQARMERGNVPVSVTAKDKLAQDGKEMDSARPSSNANANDDHDNVPIRRNTEDSVAMQQRERLRMERKRQHERNLRMENSSSALQSKKAARLEDERDVSEKIALGQHTGTGGGGVDQRLYSQEGGAGMDSGFGAEDEYNAYSKPLFENVAGSIYKPSAGAGGGQSRG
eukprot:CAMPEP_0196802144 /NCGR_PEP_ID=MMETSP1362-20130617/1823_1 /TAXON_ID=163516 /ORGANISM="Leptocylindrus danicus, Strain CCMP1856" /LENGTH=546 /DNA_ID=CAMNT_0042173361 /DNA_START=13 /DNA_END=1649 /DNA_ORIENTATION=+